VRDARRNGTVFLDVALFAIADSRRSAMRILLVSCDLDVASLVWRGLGGPGNEVVHVRTGSEAVGKARLGCDVVLLDPRLPDMSGPDVHERTGCRQAASGRVSDSADHDRIGHGERRDGEARLRHWG
jgi:hypothetical protein